MRSSSFASIAARAPTRIADGAGLLTHRIIQFQNARIHVVDEGSRHFMSDELRGQRNGVSRKRARGGDQNFVFLSAGHAKSVVEAGIVDSDGVRRSARCFHSRSQFFARIAARALQKSLTRRHVSSFSIGTIVHLKPPIA